MMENGLKQNLLIAVLLSCYAMYLFSGIQSHEAWRDEWQAINIAREATSLSDLYARLRYEGHPFLWYVCIKGAWGIYPSLVSVQLLNCAFALIAAGLIATLAPWPLWLRLMLAFTGPAAWEFSVKARSYGLGWLLLVGLAIVMRRSQSPHKKWFIVALGFLAVNTSLFTGIVASALILGWLWEEFRSGRFKSTLLPVVLMALASMGVLILVLPPADAIKYSQSAIAVSDVIGIARCFVKALVPDMGLYKASAPIVLACSTVLFASFYYVFKYRSGARLALVFGWLSFLILFLVSQFGSAPWHLWHLFLVPIAVGLAFECRPGIPPALQALFLLLAVAGYDRGVSEYIKDRNSVFSAAKLTANAIKAGGLDTLPIVVFPDYYKSSIAGYLGQPLYDGSCEAKSSYVVWRQRDESISPAIACAVKLARSSPGAQSILLLGAPVPRSLVMGLQATSLIKVSHLGSFLSDAVSETQPVDESFYMYKFDVLPS